RRQRGEVHPVPQHTGRRMVVAGDRELVAEGAGTGHLGQPRTGQGVAHGIAQRESERGVGAAGAERSDAPPAPEHAGQPTEMEGSPAETSSPILAVIRLASARRVSTISSSWTVLMTSPLTKIWPLPLPEATPRSASRASPGPLTTQPITATRSGTSRSLSPSVTSSARE